MASPVITITECGSDHDRADAMAIRFAVFVDEQGVPPDLEADADDAEARHFLARDTEGTPLGTLRILDKGNGTAKIGRVAVVREARGRGIGTALMLAALDAVRESGFADVLLDSQVCVLSFYAPLGFSVEGGEFEDAGILHRRMRLRLR